MDGMKPEKSLVLKAALERLFFLMPKGLDNE